MTVDGWVAIDQIKEHPKNPNKHSSDQIERLIEIIRYYGWRHPLIVSNQSGNLIVGHGRLAAAKKMGLKEVPVSYQDFESADHEYGFMVADNGIASWAELDLAAINLEIPDLGPDFDIDLLGIRGFEIDVADRDDDIERSNLAQEYGVPPLSILDSRRGYWVQRQRRWKELKIKSHLGRGENLQDTPTISAVQLKESTGFTSMAQGTSVFDPVLCEILIRWFSPVGGLILDPFAGGSVRGVVAEMLGRKYTGIDLRPEQVEQNQQTAKRLGLNAKWIAGDSREIIELAPGVYDLLFTCPPYADLEVYSSDPRHLSTLAYEDFIEAYKQIILKSTTLLAKNRFAAFVVGEVRNKSGAFVNFVADTISAFESAGLHYYNEMILVNQIGTKAFTCAKTFNSSRKIVRHHQNILVFVKGDAKLATKHCGPVSINQDFWSENVKLESDDSLTVEMGTQT